MIIPILELSKLRHTQFESWCGNQDSNLGRLFAKHKVFALKKTKHHYQQHLSNLPASSCEPATKPTFFFNTLVRNAQK